jgi:hypothetical protein
MKIEIMHRNGTGFQRRQHLIRMEVTSILGMRYSKSVSRNLFNDLQGANEVSVFRIKRT